MFPTFEDYPQVLRRLQPLSRRCRERAGPRQLRLAHLLMRVGVRVTVRLLRCLGGPFQRLCKRST